MPGLSQEAGGEGGVIDRAAFIVRIADAVYDGRWRAFRKGTRPYGTTREDCRLYAQDVAHKLPGLFTDAKSLAPACCAYQ